MPGPAELCPIEWPALASSTAAEAASSGYGNFGGVVPHGLRMGRTPYRDLNGQEQRPAGCIRDTETVWTAGQILIGARRAPVPIEGDLPVASYFDLHLALGSGNSFPSMRDPVRIHMSWVDQEQRLHMILNLLDSSPTFRLIVRLAVAKGRLPLSGEGRWAAYVAKPLGSHGTHAVYTGLFLPDQSRHVLSLPPLDRNTIGESQYLSHDGKLRPMDVNGCVIRTLVSVLTGAEPTSHIRWMGADGAIDPDRVAQWGVAERGAVDYLARRIARELNLDACAWLSPLPFGDGNLVTPPGLKWPAARFNDAMQEAFTSIGGVEAVRCYVEWQDDYLDTWYPT
jgi:hypothetical protein